MIDDDEFAEDKELWSEALKGSRRAKSGIDLTLEEMADNILRDARKGTTKHSEMNDYHSPSQTARRLAKEVYPASGIPDPNLYSGLFRRVHSAPRDAGPRDGRNDHNVYEFPVVVRKIENNDES